MKRSIPLFNKETLKNYLAFSQMSINMKRAVECVMLENGSQYYASQTFDVDNANLSKQISRILKKIS